jgi:adenine-specific DNA-methyltransferase
MKKELGQYFTTNVSLLDKLNNLSLNKTGDVLEPSSGAGHIVDYLIRQGDNRSFLCIELDDTLLPLPELLANREKVELIHTDFLSKSLNKKFMTIVGNPPYVKRKGKCNIYIDFIDKCVDLLEDTGELIFIIPSDFFKLTSASNVKKKMLDKGSFTHIYHPHDEGLFDKATQDIIIFRYQKGIYTKKLLYNDKNKILKCENGNIYFIDEEDENTTVILSTLFDIKVGMVSGADKIFKSEKMGNLTLKTFTGDNKYIYLDRFPTEEPIKSYLQSHKDQLISRKIKKFNDTNWFMWGCPRNISFMDTNIGKDCIYCATITRKTPVFIKGTITHFDGSLLCLFPKENIDLNKVVEYLNSDKFLSNFKFAGRYKLGQKSLLDCHIPKSLQETPNNYL